MKRPLIALLAAALTGPGCGGCGEDGPSRAPRAEQAHAGADAASAPAPANAGWTRTPPPEPDPAARGLYRRALDLAAAGDQRGADALVERIRADYPGSRFARRLADDRARAAGAFALLGVVAAAALPALVPAGPSDERRAGSKDRAL